MGPMVDVRGDDGEEEPMIEEDGGGVDMTKEMSYEDHGIEVSLHSVVGLTSPKIALEGLHQGSRGDH